MNREAIECNDIGNIWHQSQQAERRLERPGRRVSMLHRETHGLLVEYSLCAFASLTSFHFRAFRPLMEQQVSPISLLVMEA